MAFIKWFNKNIWGEVNGHARSGDEDDLDDVAYD